MTGNVVPGNDSSRGIENPLLPSIFNIEHGIMKLQVVQLQVLALHGVLKNTAAGRFLISPSGSWIRQ